MNCMTRKLAACLGMAPDETSEVPETWSTQHLEPSESSSLAGAPSQADDDQDTRRGM